MPAADTTWLAHGAACAAGSGAAVSAFATPLPPPTAPQEAGGGPGGSGLRLPGHLRCPAGAQQPPASLGGLGPAAADLGSAPLPPQTAPSAPSTPGSQHRAQGTASIPAGQPLTPPHPARRAPGRLQGMEQLFDAGTTNLDQAMASFEQLASMTCLAVPGELFLEQVGTARPFLAPGPSPCAVISTARSCLGLGGGLAGEAACSGLPPAARQQAEGKPRDRPARPPAWRALAGARVPCALCRGPRG